MSDWRFGDVLRLPHNGHPSLVMFVGRSMPDEKNPDGSTKHWGFQGVNLGPESCTSPGGPQPSGCGYDHRIGYAGALGGHPDHRHCGWEIVE